MNNLEFINCLNNIIVEQINMITVNQLLSLLKNSLNNKQNIITEQFKKFIQLPQQLILLIQENLKKQNQLVKIPGNIIIDCIDSQQLKTILGKRNLPDIIISKFDFSDIHQFQKFVFHLTNQLQLTQQQQQILNYIRISLIKTNGLFTDFNKILNCNLLLFNSSTYSRRTIQHQLTHYLQKYLNFGLTKIKLNKDIDYSKFKFLNLSQSQIKYLISKIFNKHQFIPVIDNLIDGLNFVYEKYFSKKETESEFLNRFKNLFLSKDIQKIHSSDIYKYWLSSNLSQLPLQIYMILNDVSKYLFAKVNYRLIK